MSGLFKLNINDGIKGVATAVLASVVVFVYTAITNDTSIDWHEVLKIALASGLGYIIKNFLSDSNGRILGKV